MDNKFISNRREYIIDLFKNVLEIEIDESYFKVYKGDEACFFHHRGRQLYLCYDDWKDQYHLYHMNVAMNRSGAARYHLQRWEFSLGAIFAYLSTMHNSVDMNNKKSKIDLLFEKIN